MEYENVVFGLSDSYLVITIDQLVPYSNLPELAFEQHTAAEKKGSTHRLLVTHEILINNTIELIICN
jgi:hypothetical protein